ncbi:MAG TPA: tyrosine-type recombinase/integrase [Candidatus Wallbacteria bacterium]|nr:tyrosine-type recombinase/integrase [Candidatus Wallbacteria bacterium]
MARGYLVKRGQNSWRLCYDAGRTASGERDTKYKTIKAKTMREAEQALSKFINEIESGVVTDNNIKFEQFVEIWHKDYAKDTLAPKTYAGYRIQLKHHILPTLGKLRLKDITDRVLRHFYQALREPTARKDERGGKLAELTILHSHQIVSAILEKAVRWGYIANNPARRVERPKVPRRQIKCYDENDLDKLIRAFENEPLKYRLMVSIAISTGLRRGEVMGLRWDRIDMETGSITIDQTRQYVSGVGSITKRPKNEFSVRTVTLSDSVVRLLKKHKEMQAQDKENAGSMWKDEGWVFTSWNGEPTHPDTISKWFGQFLKRHKLPHTSFHSLRHSSASVAIAEGVNMKTVSNRLGHSNISTTMDIYGHPIKRADREAADKLDKVFQNAEKKEEEIR